MSGIAINEPGGVAVETDVVRHCSSAAGSPAALNVNGIVLLSIGPLRTPTWTVSGPCHTAMLTPVDSLPSSNVVGSSCPAKTSVLCS